MQVTLAHIGAKPHARGGFDVLTASYLARCVAFARVDAESFRSEAALFRLDRARERRTVPFIVLLESRGRQMSSEALAAWLGARRDRELSTSSSPLARRMDGQGGARAAQLLLSLGPMTLAHSLARLVIAEQLYRVWTILTGHPYHMGH